MVNVRGRQQLSTTYRAKRLANEDPIHNYLCSYCQIFHREFVLGGNSRNKRVLLARVLQRFALFQISESDEDVIPGIELQNVLHACCNSRTWLLRDVNFSSEFKPFSNSGVPRN